MILGLDTSLTATGVSLILPGDSPKADFRLFEIRTNTEHSMLRRCDLIRKSVRSFFKGTSWALSASLAIIEEPIPSAIRSSTLGRVYAVVTTILSEFNIPILSVPYSKLKFVATGKNKAEKEEIISFAKKNLISDMGMTLDITDNMADAFVLSLIGCYLIDFKSQKLKYFRGFSKEIALRCHEVLYSKSDKMVKRRKKRVSLGEEGLLKQSFYNPNDYNELDESELPIFGNIHCVAKEA